MLKSMQNWRLIGPIIPRPVWFSHLLRARDLEDEEQGIVWSRLTRRDWADFDTRQDPGGRTLLLLHGTGLRTRTCFQGLTQAEYQRLHTRYEGRILAFEHRALSCHLDQNSRALARALERIGMPLDLDVLGLSRGGLVARMLVEGWESLRDDIQIHNLIFLGTPNDGTPSARRDSTGPKQMKAWRKDVRRLALVNQRDRFIEVYDDPFSIEGFSAENAAFQTWLFFHGTGDQVPWNPLLQRLNGFTGPPPHAVRQTTYYGLASVFDFNHGAPNDTLLPQMNRDQVCDWAVTQVPNDLVVPTTSVYQPGQGPDACGRFPLVRERLMVLKPSCNATHVGLFRMQGVRERILDWLGA
jgi:hypothetical protein